MGRLACPASILTGHLYKRAATPYVGSRLNRCFLYGTQMTTADTMLLTVFLRHDQSNNLDAVQSKLNAAEGGQ
jgi:hypothetical protein